MVKLKYLLFLFIILFSSNVFAAEFNMNSYTSATKTGTKNRYRATEIYNTGTSNTYIFGTQYSGRISDIETYFSYPFSANMTYRLTYNMNTDDFRNNFGSSYWWDCDHEMSNTNATVQSVNYVSYRKVTFTFTPTSATTCIRVWLRSKDLSNTAITGISNWRLNNITIYDPEWQNGSSSSSGSQGTSSGSSGTSSTNNTDEIINNATENTHTIVDNQNQNTEDIINNNNQNTEDIINNQNENTSAIENSLSNLTSAIEGCTNLLKNSMFSSSYYNSTGSLVLTGGSALGTPLIPINNNSSYYLYNLNKNYRTFVSFFDSNKNYLGRTGSNLTSTFNLNSTTQSLFSSASYISITLNNASSDMVAYLSTHIIYLIEGTGKCQNKLDSLNSSINDVKDTITDSNIDNGVGSDFFDNFNNNMHGLSSIITIPLSSIQSLSSSQCSPLHFPIPFTDNKYLDVPCMTEIYQQHVPTLLTLIQTCWYGILAYKVLVNIFGIVKGFKDPDSDKVEVMDL